MGKVGQPASTYDALQRTREHYGVKRLLLFGPRLQGAAGAQSGLDLVVEFLPGRTPGFDFLKLQDELSRPFGVPVDLHTPKSLSRHFRDEVLSRARVIYDAHR